MPDQISEDTKAKRSGALQLIEARDSRDFRAFYIGSSVEVLFEEKKEIKGKKYWIGHTREYVKAALADSHKDGRVSLNLQNRLITGKIKGFLEDEILIIEM